MVDGVSGSDLLAVILDQSPDAVTGAASPWDAGPVPAGWELAVDAIAALGAWKTRRPVCVRLPRHLEVLSGNVTLNAQTASAVSASVTSQAGTAGGTSATIPRAPQPRTRRFAASERAATKDARRRTAQRPSRAGAGSARSMFS